jgi:hypothetical protein
VTDLAGEPEEQTASPPRRINVAVTPDMLAAIDRVMDHEQVTLTEAVRRLIGYGDFLYRTVKQDGQEIIVRGEDGGERGILLV